MTEEHLEVTRWCATMPVHHRLLDTDPAYVDARTDIENQAFAWRRARREEVVTVPVVVHVVYDEESADISEEQVHSQIEVLNADFRMRNADLDRVPEPFKALIADARVEFALAATDPGGAPSSGITRTRTEVAAFDADDSVKRASTGGADAWPAERYLNVWVCRLGGGLLGYAQFPGGPPETDGVVVTHRAFGTTGTATAPFDGGRTTVHEIGHWLNLRHIWGDDGEGCWGSDFVDDTPNQGGPNRGVPEFPKTSCDNAPHGDLFVNFMDYSDDAATVMFTTGQAERMDACLAGPRSGFTTGAGNAAEPGDLAPTFPLVFEEYTDSGRFAPPSTSVREVIMSEPPQALFRRWVHIEEEDEPGVRVFRPFEDPIALGRGRDSIEFRPDGSVIRYEVSATDAPVTLDGRWRCPRPDEIYTSGSRGGLELAYKVVSVEAGELRMRPLDE